MYVSYELEVRMKCNNENGFFLRSRGIVLYSRVMAITHSLTARAADFILLGSSYLYTLVEYHSILIFIKHYHQKTILTLHLIFLK